MRRHLFTIFAALSAVFCAGTLLLWVRTELLNRTDTLVWGEAGVYRCIEFSSDDVEYKVLRDPGFPARPFQWHSQFGGWLAPPPPSNPKALPSTNHKYVLPQPRSVFFASETRSIWLPQFGFDYAEFAGWYGPGTMLYSCRLSYFVVMLPAAVLPLWWTTRLIVRRLRRRHPPGCCQVCGYDLRASRERCPECGTGITKNSESGSQVGNR